MDRRRQVIKLLVLHDLHFDHCLPQEAFLGMLGWTFLGEVHSSRRWRERKGVGSRYMETNNGTVIQKLVRSSDISWGRLRPLLCMSQTCIYPPDSLTTSCYGPPELTPNQTGMAVRTLGRGGDGTLMQPV
jgi:hypothetical protein